MHITSSTTSLSWIPSEAITGAMRLPFDLGVSHYDEPPPDRIDDLDALLAADRFRFANVLSVEVEVSGGRIAEYRHCGQGHLGSTTIALGRRGLTVAAVAYPDLQRVEDATDDRVRFVQTAGGRTGFPMPRRIDRPPFVRLEAPTVWTTLAVTVHADGRVEREVLGASPFPRHWVYDAEGQLVEKAATTDFAKWARQPRWDASPWGDEDSPALVTAVEGALEREMSSLLMRGEVRPELRRVAEGAVLCEQGEPGDELYLLLDGVLAVEVGGERLVELGPGAVLGERAVLEGGRRTSTLRAQTDCRVAVAPASMIDRDALARLAEGHRRESQAHS